MKFHWSVVCVFVLMLSPAVFVCADERGDDGKARAEYAAVLVDGKKMGHLIHRRQVDGGIVSTTEQMSLAVGRGDFLMNVEVTTTSTETVGGEPVGFEYSQTMGILSQKTVGRIDKSGKLQLTITSAAGATSQTMDWPEGALMVEGMRLVELRHKLVEGTTFTVKYFDPSMLTAMEATVKVGPKCDVDLFGRVLKLTETTVTMRMPTGSVTTVAFVDDQLETLKATTELMGMKLEIIACDREFALGDNDVVDFLDKMLLPSPTPLTDIAQKSSATYFIVPREQMQLQFPAGDNQTARRVSNGKYIVTVKPVRRSGDVKFPYKGKDPEILKALEPTRYLQCDGKKIRNLAMGAVGGTSDAMKAARQIESFVNGYITRKDMSVGYATAEEVLASRQGDCTEHAVLTAAMCRAVGIPARVVFGIVYVDELGDRKHIFGGHAWTRVRIGDKWVGLDATRSPQGFGPGHIALAVGDGDPKDFFAMTSTLGYFTIEKVLLR